MLYCEICHYYYNQEGLICKVPPLKQNGDRSSCRREKGWLKEDQLLAYTETEGSVEGLSCEVGLHPSRYLKYSRR
jgi:hypothetical protein